MKSYLLAALGAASLVSAQSAKIATNCPTGSSLCYSVHVPASAAQSGSGDLYIQVRAPSSYTWAGIGQGTGMTGAHIFVIYPNSAKTNITLSPRLAQGEFEPDYDPDTKAELLEGSGIQGNEMVANILCKNCGSWNGGSMKFNDASSNWIWAYKSGEALSSNSPAASISQHDDMGNMNFDLTKASGGANNVNPFVQAGVDTSTTSTSSGNAGSNSGGGSSSMGVAVLAAHAACMGLAIVILFPLGAMLRRLGSQALRSHVAVQLVGLVIMVVGVGLGIYTAMQKRLLMAAHPIIGLIVFVVIALQPIWGMLQHRHFKAHGSRGPLGWVHKVLGFGAILLGIVNGGLGLQLARNSPAGTIAYIVIAVLVALIWLVVIVLGMRKKRNHPAAYPKQTSPTRQHYDAPGIEQPAMGNAHPHNHGHANNYPQPGPQNHTYEYQNSQAGAPAHQGHQNYR